MINLLASKRAEITLCYCGKPATCTFKGQTYCELHADQEQARDESKWDINPKKDFNDEILR